MKPRRESDAIYSMIYEELRRVARTMKRNDSSVTINPTVLVHEAWLKLAGTPPLIAASPDEFKRIAVHAMRQVLIDAARHRNAGKRGGGVVQIEFDERLMPEASFGRDILALDDALQELERIDPRRAEGVVARFFGGFSAAEIASMLDISEATVLEDWRGARAWLSYKLRPAS